MCQVLGMMSCSPGPYGLREWAVITVPKELVGLPENKNARCSIWWNVADSPKYS